MTNRAVSAMTTKDREQLFDKAMVKRAQEAGKFIRSAGYHRSRPLSIWLEAGTLITCLSKCRMLRIFLKYMERLSLLSVGRRRRIIISFKRTTMTQDCENRLQSRSRSGTLCMWLGGNI